MQMTTKRAAVGVGLALVAAATFAALRPSPIVVETATVTKGPLSSTVDEDAVTRVAERYTVSAPIAGRHLRLDVEAGDKVAAGNVLVRIDPAPLDPRSIAELNSRLAAAEDAAHQATAAIQKTRALVAQAEREWSRIQALSGTGVASANDLDVARTALADRRADLAAALARSRAARHDTEVIRASLSSGSTGTLLLRSPADGRVLRLLHESEGVVAAGTPLVEIGDPQQIEIVIDVLSTDAVNIRPGQPVIVDGWGGNKTVQAVVRTIEPAAFTKISALGIEEQRVNVVAALTDPPRELGDGFQVQAHIVLWTGNVLKVPMTALFRDGNRWAVFTVSEGKARLRHLQTGHRGRAEIEVTNGLAAGDRVIVHPPDQVEDGKRVTEERAMD